jgi:hypothetical protein
LTAGAVQAGVIIHDADEVLRDWTVEDAGRLYFLAPDGTRWELVTQIDDPAILYQGGGAFFPVDRALVEGALAAISYPLDSVDGEVFILPYPRRALLDSETQGRALILSPGVWPLSESQVHMLVAHEVGHLVQHAFLPDGDTAGWADYRELRGIEDTQVYCGTAVHRNRPHEIFAEDFRVLYGGSLAAGSGRVENPLLASPVQVPGLQAFFLQLTQNTVPLSPGRIVSFPNPAPDQVRFALADADAPAGSAPAEISVFDVQGRRVAKLRLESGLQAAWDGRLENGSPAPPGVYFLHATEGTRTWMGKLLIAR